MSQKSLIKKIIRESLFENKNYDEELKNVEWHIHPAEEKPVGLGGSHRKTIPAYRYFESKAPYYVEHDGIMTYRILIGRKIEEPQEIIVKIGDRRLNKLPIEDLDKEIKKMELNLSNSLSTELKPNDKELERGRRLYLKYKGESTIEFVHDFFTANFEIVTKRWFANRFLEKNIITLKDLVNVYNNLT